MRTASRFDGVALGVVMLLNIAASWYPFTLDPPQRIDNTAKRLADGAWEVDSRSQVIGHAPEVAAAILDSRLFRLTVEATPTSAGQSGPARMFSIGRSPYDASLMIGLDQDHVVLLIPCSGTASNIDAEWRVPLRGHTNLAVTMWFPGQSSISGPRIQVNDDEPIQLDNKCPAGTWPRSPDAAAPWALGNVRSGHRPFVGRVDKIELEGGERRIDLLRETPWDAPASFWAWPERIYLPSNNAEHERIAGALHTISFLPIGFLMGRVARSLTVPQVLAIVFLFAACLNGGKLLVSGRHLSNVDILFNLVGAALGLLAYRWSIAGDGLTAGKR